MALLGCTHSTASSTSTSRLRLVVGGRGRRTQRPRGWRLGGTPGLGAARVAASRANPWRSRRPADSLCCFSRPQTRTAPAPQALRCFLVSYMPLAPAPALLGLFRGARRRADALTLSIDASSMLSPARLGGSSRQSAKTISITAAALAIRFALVAVAAIVDAYKPLGLRYTDVDYDVF